MWQECVCVVIFLALLDLILPWALHHYGYPRISPLLMWMPLFGSLIVAAFVARFSLQEPVPLPVTPARIWRTFCRETLTVEFPEERLRSQRGRLHLVPEVSPEPAQDAFGPCVAREPVFIYDPGRRVHDQDGAKGECQPFHATDLTTLTYNTPGPPRVLF